MAKFVNLYENQIPSSAATLGSLSALTANKGHIIIGLIIANTSETDAVTVDGWIKDTVPDPDELIYLCKNTTLGPGGAVELIEGKVVIDADTQSLWAEGTPTNLANAFVSVLENA